MKSGTTSLVTAAAELAALAVFHALGVPLVVAYAAVQVVGMAIGFTFNKLWVFSAANSGRLHAESAKSATVFAGSLILNTARPSLGAYVLHLSPIAAYLIGQGIVYAAWSFPLNRWWVFPAARAPHPVPPAR